MDDSAELSDVPDGRPSNQEARRRRWTEFAATAMPAFGSAITSRSACRGSLWSGVQAANYNQATARRMESTRESTMAGQLAGLDVAMFTAMATGLR
jgi:hypothetical protein